MTFFPFSLISHYLFFHLSLSLSYSPLFTFSLYSSSPPSLSTFLSRPFPPIYILSAIPFPLPHTTSHPTTCPALPASHCHLSLIRQNTHATPSLARNTTSWSRVNMVQRSHALPKCDLLATYCRCSLGRYISSSSSRSDTRAFSSLRS